MRSIRPSSSSATSSSCEGSPPRGGPSSRCPRAIVTGVRSSCEASWMKRSWRSSSDRRSSARRSTIASASTRRRACQTIARNIAAISGTSNSSPHSCFPSKASSRIELPVAAITTPSTPSVAGDRPDAKAVEQGEADPDEMERDRLPAGPGDHRRVVGREKAPTAKLDAVTPQRPARLTPPAR